MGTTNDIFDRCIIEAVRQGEHRHASSIAATATSMLALIAAKLDPAAIGMLAQLTAGHAGAVKAARVAVAVTRNAEREIATPTA